MATSVFLAALVILYCGFIYQVGRLTLGPTRETGWPPPDAERADIGMGATVCAGALAVGSAFYLPGPLLALVHAATLVVWGEP
jgi:hypothetical protein